MLASLVNNSTSDAEHSPPPKHCIKKSSTKARKRPHHSKSTPTKPNKKTPPSS